MLFSTISMQTQLLKKGVCERLDTLSNNFFWSSPKADNLDHQNIHLIHNVVIHSKKSIGGLGFRYSYSQNLSLLAKLCGRILSEPDSLWVKVLKTKYFCEVFFLDAKCQPYHPIWWKDLLHTCDIFFLSFLFLLWRGL